MILIRRTRRYYYYYYYNIRTRGRAGSFDDQERFFEKEGGREGGEETSMDLTGKLRFQDGPR